MFAELSLKLTIFCSENSLLIIQMFLLKLLLYLRYSVNTVSIIYTLYKKHSVSTMSNGLFLHRLA